MAGFKARAGLLSYSFWLQSNNEHSCTNPKCVNCSFVDRDTTFQSLYGGPVHTVCNSSGESTVSCKTKNLIYLITCDQCGMQYVGETSQFFKSRIGQHRSGIKTKRGCRILTKHFNSGCTSFKAKIIEALPYLQTEEETNKARRVRESFFIRELRTKYPYGLNDRLLGDNANNSVFSEFNKHKPAVRVRGKKNSSSLKKRFLHSSNLDYRHT